MRTLLHHASEILCKPSKKILLEATQNVKLAQTERLHSILSHVAFTPSGKRYGILPNMSVESFQNIVPISEYDDWAQLILQQRKQGSEILSEQAVQRYQPTSGSRSRVKWIPYTKAFLDELDGTIGPWFCDLYRRYPRLKKGRHYWSLSWVPSDLRDKITGSINDDAQLLPWWRRLFLARTMAVPEKVALAETSEASFFATCCYIASCRDLSLISVWSPTFALSLLQFIQTNRNAIAHTLREGKWATPFESLDFLDAPQSREAANIVERWDGNIDASFTQALWPSLALVSAWDTSSSALWADEIRNLFPHADFQGKGLWTTEGVVTFPFEEHYPLSVSSHFYEFEDLSNGQIFTSWELQQDQIVRPILTTGNGLLRYRSKDKMRVTGFLNQCPCLEFISRIDGVDMVGEKMSPDIAVNLLQQCRDFNDFTPVTVLAIPASQGSSPRYVLLCDGASSADIETLTCRRQQLREFCEAELNKHYHYQLARELGQLAEMDVLISPDAISIYTDAKVASGMVASNIKIEPLLLWPGATLPSPLKALIHTEPPELASSRVV